jgi:hypothetical protein
LGLTDQAIQTDVEQKLRQGGVRVVTPEEAHRLPGRPHLYVNVNLTDNGRAASIDLELDQDVRLERNGQTVPSVATWVDDALIAPNTTGQHIRDVIKNLVDHFLNAWLSFNPKN